jgi:hypothetical protein
MVETIPADVLNLIYVLIAVAGGYMVFRKFGDIIKVKIKSTTTREKKNYDDSKDIDGQLDNFISNAPRILAEIQTEMRAQKEAGVTPEQMKGMASKAKMLEFVVQNKEIIEIIGTPILKKIVGFIKAI